MIVSELLRPKISHQDQDEILALLYGFLDPVGKYRSQYVIVSQGKRAKKQAKKTKAVTDQKFDQELNDAKTHLEVKMQDILKHLTVGFNSTTRYLENIAQKSALIKSQATREVGNDAKSTPGPGQENKPEPNLPPIRPLAAVFVPDSAQAAKLFAHLPILIQAGNLGVPDPIATRLILYVHLGALLYFHAYIS